MDVTVRSLLHGGRERLREASIAEPRLTAEILLADALGVERPWVIAHPEGLVRPDLAAEFEAWVSRRAGREPLQYIRGRQEFYGRDFAVDRRALIPRPETEGLIEQCLERIRPGDRVVEVGTGSGCVAVTLALEAPGTRICSVDISAAALELAEDNRARYAAAVEFVHGDLLSAFAGASLDAVVSNPPYAADAEWPGLEPEVRDFEPRSAIVAGETGLESYRRLIPEAARVLKPGGWIALELGHESLGGVGERFAAPGWSGLAVFHDLAGHARVVRCDWRV